MENKIISTAEEILDKKFKMENPEHDTKVFMYDALDAMIEFAKLHVQAALESAAENAICFDDYIEVDKQSILNAYPLDNIK